MNWRRRSTEKELLDGEGIPFDDLLQNLKELDLVNTLLGGHATTLEGLNDCLQPKPEAPVHIAEIGCGGGDNLRVIHRALQQRGIPHRLTGIDLKPECIRYAQQAQDVAAAIDWQCCDYREARWSGELPDVIFSSLFCHHFTDDELVAQLRWLQVNSRRGFFINDLHRHPLAYHAIRLCTRLFSKSYLVRNDAPLSVQRSFLRAEWQTLFRQAGLQPPRIHWRWAFRYLVVWNPHA